MSDEASPIDPQVEPAEPGDEVEFSSKPGSKISLRTLGLLIGGLLVIDILAFLLVPPLDTKHPGETCEILDTACLVNGTLHLPRPHEVWVAGGAEPATGLITFQVSLTALQALDVGSGDSLEVVGLPFPGPLLRVE